MSKAKRKIVTLIVEVSAAPELSAARIRSEVRGTLRAHVGEVWDVNVRSVKPAGGIIAAARRAWEAWGGGPKPKPGPLPLIDYINDQGGDADVAGALILGLLAIVLIIIRIAA